MFPTTSLEVPHVIRSFLFRKLDSTATLVPLIVELSFKISFFTQKGLGPAMMLLSVDDFLKP